MLDSPGSSRRMRLEDAARKLADSGLSNLEIIDQLNCLGVHRQEARAALASLDGIA